MLKPEKYSNLEVSVIGISTLILSLLIKEKIIKYDELLCKIVKTKGESAKVNFLPSLNFLFLLEKIEYHKKIDSIEIKT